MLLHQATDYPSSWLPLKTVNIVYIYLSGMLQCTKKTVCK